jgi:hypothetical protein
MKTDGKSLKANKKLTFMETVSQMNVSKLSTMMKTKKPNLISM